MDYTVYFFTQAGIVVKSRITVSHARFVSFSECNVYCENNVTSF